MTTPSDFLGQTLRLLARRADLPAGFLDPEKFALVDRRALPVLRGQLDYEVSWSAQAWTYASQPGTTHRDGRVTTYTPFATKPIEGAVRGRLGLPAVCGCTGEASHVLAAAEQFKALDRAGSADLRAYPKSPPPDPRAIRSQLDLYESNLQAGFPGHTLRTIDREVARAADAQSEIAGGWQELTRHDRFQVRECETYWTPVTRFCVRYGGRDYSLAVSGLSDISVTFDKLPRRAFVRRRLGWFMHAVCWMPALFNIYLWCGSLALALAWGPLERHVADRQRAARLKASLQALAEDGTRCDLGDVLGDGGAAAHIPKTSQALERAQETS